MQSFGLNSSLAGNRLVLSTQTARTGKVRASRRINSYPRYVGSIRRELASGSLIGKQHAYLLPNNMPMAEKSYHFKGRTSVLTGGRWTV